MNLLTMGNPKTAKGEALGWLTGAFHLAPHALASKALGRRVNVCPHATAGCIAVCLNTAGRAGIFRVGERTNAIQESRIRRTVLLMEDPVRFARERREDLAALERLRFRKGLKATAVRLNATSDVAWEEIDSSLFAERPEVTFYDYTKDPGRAIAAATRPDWWPPNYHLTFSYSGENLADCKRVLEAGGRVAVVADKAVSNETLREMFGARRVVDGDAHDLIFTHPKRAILRLRPKGKAEASRSPFVVR